MKFRELFLLFFEFYRNIIVSSGKFSVSVCGLCISIVVGVVTVIGDSSQFSVMRFLICIGVWLFKLSVWLFAAGGDVMSSRCDDGGVVHESLLSMLCVCRGSDVGEGVGTKLDGIGSAHISLLLCLAEVVGTMLLHGAGANRLDVDVAVSLRFAPGSTL